MTNQQLKAHCEDVIANPQDHLDWVVNMARVALSSLEAEPEQLPSPFDAFSSNTDWQKGFIEGQKYYRDELGELGPLYTAPPVAVMQPVKLPVADIAFHSKHGSLALVAYQVAVKEAIRAAGGSVKE